MSLVSKRGDAGDTDLLYGGRVPKDSPRAEAYGTVDEAVSALGIARALAGSNELLQTQLLQIQRELFLVAAEMATDPASYGKLLRQFGQITPAMVENLERLIDECSNRIHMPDGFVVPGGSVLSAHLDLARTIVRRAERRAAGLWREQLLVNDQVLRYLNRLSDALFVLARAEEQGATTLVKDAQPPQKD